MCTANNIGPQVSFPVPQGILNYQGDNSIALSLWSLEAGGAKLEGLTLVSTAMIQTGYGDIASSPQPAYAKRSDAY